MRTKNVKLLTISLLVLTWKNKMKTQLQRIWSSCKNISQKLFTFTKGGKITKYINHIALSIISLLLFVLLMLILILTTIGNYMYQQGELNNI